MIVDQNPLAKALDHGTLGGEVERHDRNVLLADVLPDICFGPIGERKNPDRFSGIDSRVVKIPQLGTLSFGLPTMARRAKRKNALFGARFLLVAPGAAESHVKAVQNRALA